jgi:hypothetical protein
MSEEKPQADEPTFVGVPAFMGKPYEIETVNHIVKSTGPFKFADPKFIGESRVITEECVGVFKDGKFVDFFAFERTPDPVEDQKVLDALWERLHQKTDVDKYRDTQGVAFEPPPESGYAVIEVLQHLKGLPLCDMVMAHVRGLRPSSVRVTSGFMTADAETWRVTITVDDNDVVTKIEQEIEISYGSGRDVGNCVWAHLSNARPRASSGCYGHTAGLERADFS